MARVVRVPYGLLVMVLLVTLAGWLTTVYSQNVQWTDEQAGRHIDFISDRGIKLLNRWRDHFMSRLSVINSTLNYIEDVLANELGSHALPNLTEIIQDKISALGLDSKATNAQNKLNALNLTEREEPQPVFYKSDSNTVNLLNAYDPNNRDSGTFTAPQAGLYKVYSHSTKGSYLSASVMRNGNVTLTTHTQSSYYDAEIRVALVNLNAGDEIFQTGGKSKFFGVKLLYAQTLLPST